MIRQRLILLVAVLATVGAGAVGTLHSAVAANTAYQQIVFDPTPIMGPGTLQANQQVTVSVFPELTDGSPVGEATVYLSLTTIDLAPSTAEAGTANVNGKPLAIDLQAFTADTSGVISVTYTAPAVLPVSGRDVITAQDRQSSPTFLAVTDSYSFSAVTSYSWTPAAPIAAAGTLAATESRKIKVTALAGLTPDTNVGNTTIWLSLNTTTATASPGGSATATDGSNPAKPITTSLSGFDSNSDGVVTITYSLPSSTPPSAGVDTLKAENPLNPSVTAVTTYAFANQMTITTSLTNNTTNAGVTFDLTVTPTNQAYAGTVRFTSTDARAKLPKDYSFTSAIHTQTFSGVVLETSGLQTVTVTDLTDPAITDTTATITVSPGVNRTFSFVAPTSAVAGSPIDVTVISTDTFGNRDPAYAGRMELTSTDRLASPLPIDYTYVPLADQGAHIFSVTLNTSGNQTVTATDVGIRSITATSPRITVGADHFSVTTSLTNNAATAGVPFDVTVTALGSSGVTDKGYAGTVRFTSTDPVHALPSDYTFLAGTDNGTHTFSASDNKGATLFASGPWTVTVTDTGGSPTGTTSLTVSAAAATHYSVTAPISIALGSPLEVTVNAQDPWGNTDTVYTGTALLTSSDSKATGLSAKPLINGVVSFSVKLNTSGSQTVTATDNVASRNITGSATIAVSAGDVTKYTVTAPSKATADLAMNVTVTAVDKDGTRNTTYVGTAHFASTDANAVLPGPYTFTGTDAGMHSFAVTLKTVGSWTVTATDAAAAAITGTSGSIAVTLAAADNQNGLYTLDGLGGVHPVGSAPAVATTAYWPNWDIARGIVTRSDHTSGYVVDGLGGIHSFGVAGDMPPTITGEAYFPGWDIVRGIVLRSDGISGYTLDGWGGLHPFGDAPPITGESYWPGWDIARGVVLRSDGISGYTLDGWGGVHAFGGAPSVTATSYWAGWDIARGIALMPGGTGGYVLDGLGGLHQFGDAAPVSNESYWPNWDIARGIAAWGSSSSGTPGGWVVDGWGGVHPFGNAPAEKATGYWAGWKIVRGIG